MARVASVWGAAQDLSGKVVPVRVHVLCARGEPGIRAARSLGGFLPSLVSGALAAAGFALPAGRLFVDMAAEAACRDPGAAHVAVAAALLALSGALDAQEASRSMFAGELLADGGVRPAFCWGSVCAAAGRVGAEPVLARSVSDLPLATGREGGAWGPAGCTIL